MEKKELNIIYLGGSITEGSGASSYSKTWTGIVTEFFKQAYPDKQVNCINAGVGGTGSDYGILRLYDDVIAKKPDIVFVEFAVNDIGINADEIKYRMEGIVRNLLTIPDKPIIVFLYTTTNEFNAVDSVHQEVADYYGIPSINLQSYIKYMSAKTGLKTQDIFTDGVHPNDKGHRLYADYIIQCLNMPEIYLKSAVARDNPLNINYIANMGCLRSVSGADIFGKWTENGKGLITDEMGATIIFNFEGSILAILNRIGNNFGKMEVNIDGNIRVVIDNYYNTENQPVMWYKNFSLSDCSHRVEIKALGEKNADSSGTKVGIDGIMVKR